MNDRPDFTNLSCPLPHLEYETVQLAHGAGGRLAAELTRTLILPRFSCPELDRLEDQAILDLPPGRIAFSTDTFVVDPVFFPGGDIGDLAVNGTVNDVAMSGAQVLALSVGLVLEEGLPLADLHRILCSMEAAARTAGVRIVTGDTKVVGKGACDRIFINTSGIGVVPEDLDLGAALIRPGDVLLVSGTIADHGMAVLTKREGLSFAGDIQSDTAALNGLVRCALTACPGIRALRDPTRGGLAATLNEFAAAAGVGIEIREDAVPVRPQVQGACELLGLDPLCVANEGKLVAAVPAEAAAAVLAALRSHPLGQEAAIIGAATADHPRMVGMRTVLGALRLVDWPAGEHLPRIC